MLTWPRLGLGSIVKVLIKHFFPAWERKVLSRFLPCYCQRHLISILLPGTTNRKNYNCMSWIMKSFWTELHLAHLLGSWTLDNYRQKLEAMENEKVQREEMIAEYLQNQQHEIDKGLFSNALHNFFLTSLDNWLVFCPLGTNLRIINLREILMNRLSAGRSSLGCTSWCRAGRKWGRYLLSQSKYWKWSTWMQQADEQQWNYREKACWLQKYPSRGHFRGQPRDGRLSPDSGD